MKRIKNLISLLLISILFAVCTTTVHAAGTADLGFSGSDSVEVGKQITVKFYIKNIANVPGGVVGIGGDLSFDSDYLEYVSGTGMSSPYAMSINTDIYRMSGMDLTMSNGLTNTAEHTVFTFVFKAKKVGETEITVINPLISDKNAQPVTTTLTDKSIKITEAVVQSTDATLKSLSVSGCTISPAFSSATTSYTCTVENSVTSVTVSAGVNDSKATITSGTGTKNLNVGSNTISVVVKAESGATKSYNITVTRKAADGSSGGGTTTKSNDATLKGLSVSGYTISPSFSSTTTSYSVTVPNTATEVIVNATPNHSGARASVTGNTNLKVGANTVNILVTAEDGSTKSYNIIVTKEAAGTTPTTPVGSSDATLKSLNISGYTLSPTFNAKTTVYSIKVGNNITSLNVSAVPTSDKASVSVSGNTGWKVGVNTVTVRVTAENGSQNTYIINVTRAGSSTTNSGGSSSTKSSDNFLSSLIIKDGTLSPEFDKNTSNYSITVPYQTETLDISYELSNRKAKVEVTGNENLLVGEVSTIQLIVTAEDGSIRIYTVNATRSALSGNVLVKAISIDGYKLSPSFDPEVTTYKVTVDADTSKLDLDVILEDSNAEYEVTGNGNFVTGNNVILIKVTDSNGFAKYYQINVTKEDKSEATIAGLGIGHFLLLTFIILALIALIVLLIVFIAKRNEKKTEEKKTKEVQKPTEPTSPFTLNFNPEINVASKKESDDDVVYDNGILNQGDGDVDADRRSPKEISDKKVIEGDVYDVYDEKVTKDELFDAIEEAKRTKDSKKLKLLLSQEKLNREKQRIKEEEEKKDRKARSDRDE